MQRDTWDDVIDRTNDYLPKFNSYLLRGYRQDQVNAIPEALDMVFSEAVKRFGFEEDGVTSKVKYIGHRFMTPEEIMEMNAMNPKFSNCVDVLRTEQAPTLFRFEYDGQEFTIQINIPFLCEDALIVNGSRYYALTDRVFYHIVKNSGIGIKILCAHLRFWRMFRYAMVSTKKHVYGDHIVITKIHLRDYKYTADDLQTALLLYPLVKFGLKETLRRYNIDPAHITVVTEEDKKDHEHEYFWIPITSEERDRDWNGIYLKVHNSILEIDPKQKSQIKLQVVTALHYILTYFEKCRKTTYTDRNQLVWFLQDDPTFMVYKVILGKTIFGINYDNEVQVAGHINDHLQSLEIYMDPETKRKLRTIGVECNDVYDLVHYVSLHMDEYVSNYFPSNVYNKQMNMLDLLLGGLVNSLFYRIYRQTNNRKGDRPYTLQQIQSSFRVSSRVFNKIYLCAGLIAGNPSVYNDNGLLTVLGRRKRATFTTPKAGGGSATGKKKGGSDTNLLQDPEHRLHSSLYIVESGSRTQPTDPTKSGTINGFLIVNEDGELIIPDWLKEIAKEVDQYTYAK